MSDRIINKTRFDELIGNAVRVLVSNENKLPKRLEDALIEVYILRKEIGTTNTATFLSLEANDQWVKINKIFDGRTIPYITRSDTEELKNLAHKILDLYVSSLTQI